MNNQKSRKAMWIDFFVCFFLGFYGIHKFREKKILWGLLYLFTMGLFGFGWIYDSAIYLYTLINTRHAKETLSNDENDLNNNTLFCFAKAKKIGLLAVATWLIILIFVGAGIPDADPVNQQADESQTITNDTGTTGADLEQEISFDDVVKEEPEDNLAKESEINSDTLGKEPISEDETIQTEKPESQTQEKPIDVHTHSFVAATCTEAKKCSSCGITEGEAVGHNWKEATCTTAKVCLLCGIENGSATGHNWEAATCTTSKKCSICGVKDGAATGHNYFEGKCSTCGSKDPNYTSEVKVWIPTKGGTKYHRNSTCSQMEGPEYVTKDEAINRGFGPCGRCYK